MKYPARFVRAAEGGWLINFRDLPEAISQAEESEDREEVVLGLPTGRHRRANWL